MHDKVLDRENREYVNGELGEKQREILEDLFQTTNFGEYGTLKTFTKEGSWEHKRKGSFLSSIMLCNMHERP